MEVTIAGKRVTFRDRLPAKQNWDLIKTFQKFSDMDNLDFDQLARVFAAMVESWEFDGDPADIASYGALDTFSEFLPLMNAVGDVFNAKMGNPKN